MIMGVLSSMLSGAAYGTELGSLEAGAKPGQDGHFVMALRVGAFEDIAVFKARVDQAIQQIHDCQLAPGFARTYAPGEVETINRATYGKQGFRSTDYPSRSHAGRAHGWLGASAIGGIGKLG